MSSCSHFRILLKKGWQSGIWQYSWWCTHMCVYVFVYIPFAYLSAYLSWLSYLLTPLPDPTFLTAANSDSLINIQFRDHLSCCPTLSGSAPSYKVQELFWKHRYQTHLSSLQITLSSLLEPSTTHFYLTE